MSKGIRFVRSVYWIGVVLDAFSVVPFLWPALFLESFQIDASGIGVAVRFPAYMAASLMAGWTALLVWGAISPIERRGTLLVTVVPTLMGLIAGTVYLGTVVPAGFTRVIPMLMVQVIVLGLVTSAWLVAGKEAERERLQQE